MFIESDLLVVGFTRGVEPCRVKWLGSAVVLGVSSVTKKKKVEINKQLKIFKILLKYFLLIDILFFLVKTLTFYQIMRKDAINTIQYSTVNIIQDYNSILSYQWSLN